MGYRNLHNIPYPRSIHFHFLSLRELIHFSGSDCTVIQLITSLYFYLICLFITVIICFILTTFLFISFIYLFLSFDSFLFFFSFFFFNLIRSVDCWRSVTRCRIRKLQDNHDFLYIFLFSWRPFINLVKIFILFTSQLDRTIGFRPWPWSLSVVRCCSTRWARSTMGNRVYWWVPNPR